MLSKHHEFVHFTSQHGINLLAILLEYVKFNMYCVNIICTMCTLFECICTTYMHCKYCMYMCVCVCVLGDMVLETLNHEGLNE